MLSDTLALWLLYVCLDRLVLTLLSTRVSLLERTTEIISAQSFQCGETLVQYEYLSGYLSAAPISRPSLVLEASPHNIGVPSWVSLLPSHYIKGNLSLGTFIPLEKAAIMFN